MFFFKTFLLFACDRLFEHHVAVPKPFISLFVSFSSTSISSTSISSTFLYLFVVSQRTPQAAHNFTFRVIWFNSSVRLKFRICDVTASICMVRTATTTRHSLLDTHKTSDEFGTVILVVFAFDLNAIRRDWVQLQTLAFSAPQENKGKINRNRKSFAWHVRRPIRTTSATRFTAAVCGSSRLTSPRRDGETKRKNYSKTKNWTLTECDFRWLTPIDSWPCRRPIWLACVVSMAVMSLHLVIYRRQRWRASVHCAYVCASVSTAVGSGLLALRISHLKWLCALCPTAAPLADLSLENYAISTCCWMVVCGRRRWPFPLVCVAILAASCYRNCSLWWMAFVSMNRQNCFVDWPSWISRPVRTIDAYVASVRPVVAVPMDRLDSGCSPIWHSVSDHFEATCHPSALLWCCSAETGAAGAMVRPDSVCLRLVDATETVVAANRDWVFEAVDFSVAAQAPNRLAKWWDPSPSGRVNPSTGRHVSADFHHDMQNIRQPMTSCFVK